MPTFDKFYTLLRVSAGGYTLAFTSPYRALMNVILIYPKCKKYLPIPERTKVSYCRPFDLRLLTQS